MNERVCPNAYVISLFPNGIIEIDWSANIGEVTVQHLIELRDAIKEFGKGKKMPVYISTDAFMNITSEARRYAASEIGQEFTLANAVLIDNLGKRLAFNFFLKINKPSVPTKAFDKKEDAIKWLQYLNSQHNP